jgi:hypothetical protein
VVPVVKVKGLEVSETVVLVVAIVGALAVGVLWWRAAGKRDA